MAFFAFVFGTSITLVGLLALTVAVVAREGQRPFALVPAGTMAGILFFVAAGGPSCWQRGWWQRRLSSGQLIDSPSAAALRTRYRGVARSRFWEPFAQGFGQRVAGHAAAGAPRRWSAVRHRSRSALSDREANFAHVAETQKLVDRLLGSAS
jgi:hypothetical protein